ncbi:17815_t:CDS:2 [Rhizophagus irregularis]|nr:17815_t:CDS:2 [Rhizophagus irregularis]
MSQNRAKSSHSLTKRQSRDILKSEMNRLVAAHPNILIVDNQYHCNSRIVCNVRGNLVPFDPYTSDDMKSLEMCSLKRDVSEDPQDEAEQQGIRQVKGRTNSRYKE